MSYRDIISSALSGAMPPGWHSKRVEEQSAESRSRAASTFGTPICASV